MLTIRYDNVWASIQRGTNEEIAKVSHALSYSPKGSKYWKNNTSGRELKFSMLHDRYHSFPAGLVDWLISRKHKGKNPKTEDIEHYTIEAELIDARPHLNFQLKEIDLWDEKKKAPLELRDYQKEAIETFLEKQRGIIRLSPGAGKTVIGLAITQTLGLKTLFVVNNKSLLKQPEKEYKSKLKVVPGVIGDNEWNPKEITVATVQTLSRRLNTSSTKEFLKSIELVIFDEVQHASKTYQLISRAMPNARFRLGLSATALMGDKESKLQSMAITGPIIYEVKMKKLVEDKQLAKPTAIFLHIDGDEDYGYMEWDELYSVGIVHNEYRNLAICGAVLFMRARGYSSLVLVEKIDHGKILEEMLSESGLKIRYVSGQHTSNQREEAKTDLQTGELDVLITTRIFNEGVDIPMLESVIIASGYRSAGLTFQRYGRGIRKTTLKEHTIIVDCYDSFNGLLEKHSDERLGVCKKNKAFDIEVCTYENLEATIDKVLARRKK